MSKQRRTKRPIGSKKRASAASKRTKARAKAKPRAKPRKRIAAAPAPAAPAPAANSPHDSLVDGEQQVVAAKFALAPESELRLLDEREKSQSIPWGYGRDKVTAMAVDPERLYAYWEVTDEAIAKARAELGRSGDDSWLNLRVHDVTGLLFDGGNAHHTLDVGVARSDRQWFLEIGRPTSEVIVELGLLARDGRFAPIARSKRVEFPRREPAPPGPVEWLDVRPVGHGDGRPHLELQRAVTRDGASQESDGGGWRDARGEFWIAGAPWSSEAPADFVGGLGASSSSFWNEWVAASSHGLNWTSGVSSWQWIGPTVVERWEAGPFPVEVALPEVTEERRGGAVTVQSWRGFTRVQYGPWSVTIRGLRAHGGGRVLARWEIKKSWVVEESVERFSIVAWSHRSMTHRLAPGGASEQVGASEAWLQGASERRLLAGSEIRLGGASELYWLGASELNFGGVAARSFGGASERRFAGASERRMAGASERRFAGASERRLGGGSEARLGGASEARLLPALSAPSAT